MSDKYYGHFFIKLDSTKVKKHLTRENFAIIETKCGNDKYIRYYTEHWDYFEKIKEKIDIDKCPIDRWPPSYKYTLENGVLRLSDMFCQKYQEACLIVYDANINYFKKLDSIDFNKKLNELLKKNSSYREIKNLYEVKGKSGIYIMVLDRYKQIYIGQSKDIYQRICRHWKKQPQFDRLIFPSIENSNISIDSFGTLDTTRIYAKEIHMKNMYSLDKEEEKIVEEMPQKYLLNRIGGGLRLNTISDLGKFVNSANERELN